MACTRRSPAVSPSWVGHERRAASRRKGRRFRVWNWRHPGLSSDDPVSPVVACSRLSTTGLLPSASSRATASAVRNRCPKRPQRLRLKPFPVSVPRPTEPSARKPVGLWNTRDDMVHREAPPKRPQRTKIGPCEQRQLLASAGCGTINPANSVPPHSPICQRQSSLSRQRGLKGRARAQGRATAMRGGVRRVRSPPWWRRASARARAAGVAQGRRAAPTVPRSCPERCGRY
jgi:hypothetical protein